jgi:hypothetical protein
MKQASSSESMHVKQFGKSRDSDNNDCADPSASSEITKTVKKAVTGK